MSTTNATINTLQKQQEMHETNASQDEACVTTALNKRKQNIFAKLYGDAAPQAIFEKIKFPIFA